MTESSQLKSLRVRTARFYARADERAQTKIESAIFALLIAFTALAALPYGSVDPWWEGFVTASLFLLGILWIIEGFITGGGWFVEEQRLLFPSLILVAYAFAQTIPYAPAEMIAGVEFNQSLSADPYETQRFALKLAAVTLAVALWLRYASGSRRLIALLWTVAGVGCVSALFGIARLSTPKASMALFSPRLAQNLDGFAQFINRNHFAFLAEMALGASLGLLLSARARRASFAAPLVASFILWFSLVVSNSRGGVLASVVTLSVAAALYFVGPKRAAQNVGKVGEGVATSSPASRDKAFKLLRAALAFSLLGGLPLAGAALLGGERLTSRFGDMAYELGIEEARVRWGDRRIEIWSATIELIRERPLAGWGFAAYRAAVTRHHDASGEMSLEQAHNDYLELLASGGVIAAVAVLWMLLLFVRRSRAVLRSPDPSRRALCAGALAGLAGAAFHSLFDFGLHITINALVFAPLVATAVLGSRVSMRDVAGRRRANLKGGDDVARREESIRSTDSTQDDEDEDGDDLRANVGEMSRARESHSRRDALTCVSVILSLLLFYFAAWQAMKTGVARLFAESSTRLVSTPYEFEAPRLAALSTILAPADPEAHHARAVAFAQLEDLAGAVMELESAAKLQPDYYLTWLRLGRVRELAGDFDGALAAYERSAILAPFYAGPRWHAGNALLRAGRRDEAFQALRLAASSRPSLFPYTIELAWEAYGEEARAVVEAVEPASPQERFALARFLVARGEGQAALETYRAAGERLSEERRRALVADMIEAKMFAEAYEVWAEDDRSAATSGDPSAIFNGGFEAQTEMDGEGFEWNFKHGVKDVAFSLDASAPRGGERSLLVDFRGMRDPAPRIFSRLLRVEPGAHYRLTFASRTERLASGVMPSLVVLDANREDAPLAESPKMPRDTGGWREFEMEFLGPESGAVLIALQRGTCEAVMCPITGRAWFDDFALERTLP